jgi:hypothetical protein
MKALNTHSLRMAPPYAAPQLQTDSAVDWQKFSCLLAKNYAVLDVVSIGGKDQRNRVQLGTTVALAVVSGGETTMLNQCRFLQKLKRKQHSIVRRWGWWRWFK